MTNLITRGISTILRVIYKVLPKHVQRLVLWSTLYNKLCGSKSLTKEEAVVLGERLNSTLAIANDAKACVLPFALTRFITNELDKCTSIVRKTIKEGDTGESNLKEFVRSIPSWMRYASESFIQRDLQAIVSFHKPAIA